MGKTKRTKGDPPKRSDFKTEKEYQNALTTYMARGKAGLLGITPKTGSKPKTISKPKVSPPSGAKTRTPGTLKKSKTKRDRSPFSSNGINYTWDEDKQVYYGDLKP